MSNINISGSIVGIGKISYNLNSSKLKAHNPTLVSEEISYNTGDCPIAAFEYQNFSPNKIINIKSKENSIYENTMDFYKMEYISYNNGYFTKHYPYYGSYSDKLKFLVTDHFSNIQNGKPLFYQYELKFDAYANISGILINNIYKNNEIKIDKSEFKVQYSNDLLLNNNIRYSDTDWSFVPTNRIHRIRVLLPHYFSVTSDFFSIEYDRYVFGVQNYQKELIEISPIYNSGDFQITNSEINLPLTSKLKTNKTIVLMKDPTSRVAPLDIISIKDQNLYSSDSSSQWNLRINAGSFYIPSNTYLGGDEKLFNVDVSETKPFYISFIKPFQIKSNILQVKESPIYIDNSTYTYPLYKIDMYDKTNLLTQDASGKFAIDVNGITRKDIQIKSIDRKKGFIELDTDLNPTDEIDLFFCVDNGYVLLNNVELNPKLIDTTAGYKISDYKNGFGIAIHYWEGSDVSKFPYIYDISTPTIGKQIPMVGSGVMVNIDEHFFRICEIDLNKLTVDMVKVTDARRLGGGITFNSELDNWFDNYYGGVYKHEKSWYSDVGNFDGQPLAHNSMILIHIPQDLIDIMRNKWINHYKEYFDDYSRAESIGDKEFKFNLDQTIRKYISAGTEYLIIPTINGQITGKFLNLR